jgi:glycosyltransferase involved in cell wall biosynthesis
MATYNGTRWIEAQLQSVLSQLSENDELVIVDDASSDNTLERVGELRDKRIRVFRNARNLGVDLTFQKALSLARGDVLFLCDQDDIWYPGKVSRVMQVFDEHPDVTLVLSDARIIDSEGQVIAPSYFGMRGAFTPGVFANIVKSKFLGCAMAVKRGMRDRFLPFPEKIPGHDMWIGVVNEFYGKTFFIADPLIGYRRHGKNTSPERRQGLAQMLIWRWQLIGGLAKRVVMQILCWASLKNE